jgi:hypothetical protein
MTSVATATGRPRSLDRAPRTASRTRVPEALLACGVLSSLLYVAINVLGSWRWHEYSSRSQTISELFAIDAPSRSLAFPLGVAYDVLLFAFGVGVWLCADRRALRVAACLIVAMGAMGPFWPPMHLRGTLFTLTDTMHIAFAAAQVLFTLVAIGFAATAFGRRFRVYSIATLVILVAFGALTGIDGPRIAANLPTPWIGVTERINVGAYLLWVAVLAVALLRAPEIHRPSRALPPKPPTE